MDTFKFVSNATQNYFWTPPPPQPFYSPFSGTTRVSQCQKRTSGLYGARKDWQRQTHRSSGWAPLHPDSAVPTSTVPHFLQAVCPSCRPTNSVKALKATSAFGFGEKMLEFSSMVFPAPSPYLKIISEHKLPNCDNHARICSMRLMLWCCTVCSWSKEFDITCWYSYVCIILAAEAVS